MRRRSVIEPPSRLAHWSRRVVLFAIAVALFALVLVRGSLIEAVPGVVILGAAVVLGLVGVGLAVGALLVIWRNGNPGLGHALIGLFGGLALAAYPTYVAVDGLPRPVLPDVSTDTADPPRFEAVALVRGPSANPVAYAAEPYAGRQRRAYPDIAPLVVEATPEQAYAAALAVITRLRWTIIEARGYIAGQRDGRIEAVARTALMGFRDDIVLRVRALPPPPAPPVAPTPVRPLPAEPPVPDTVLPDPAMPDPGTLPPAVPAIASIPPGAVIDIRSASRYGGHDLGTNADRVRRLLAEIERAAAQAAR